MKSLLLDFNAVMSEWNVTVCMLLIPGAESHQWDGSAREEDGDQQERPPPPHVRQRTNQRGRHERQQALESPRHIFMLTG